LTVLIYDPLVSLVKRYVITKLQAFRFSPFLENRRHGTDGRGATLNAALYGRILIIIDFIASTQRRPHSTLTVDTQYVEWCHFQRP